MIAVAVFYYNTTFNYLVHQHTNPFKAAENYTLPREIIITNQP